MTSARKLAILREELRRLNAEEHRRRNPNKRTRGMAEAVDLAVIEAKGLRRQGMSDEEILWGIRQKYPRSEMGEAPVAWAEEVFSLAFPRSRRSNPHGDACPCYGCAR